MILLITNSYCSSADAITHILKRGNIDFFRFNTDFYNKYKFSWSIGKNFTFEDPCGRRINSDNINIVCCYKATLGLTDNYDFCTNDAAENLFVKNTINYIINSIFVWGAQNKKNRLWPLREYSYPKTLQHEFAKKYFSLLDAEIHWGYSKKSEIRMFKTLVPYIKDNSFTYVSPCNLKDLDPDYPWFTQKVSDNDCDATILYINGKVHCYQFATERGNLTDWRITQGTEANQWIPWDAGKEFEEKVDLYMKDLGLKFGRLDFIIGGKEPQFLEVNPCGQFGWLDDENLTLHNEVVDAILDPSSTITL